MTRTIKSSSGSLVLYCVLAAGLTVTVSPSRAADPAMTVEETRVCLCQEQRIMSVRNALESPEAQAQQQELAEIDRKIVDLRATMDPDDALRQEHMKYLIERQQYLREQNRQRIRVSGGFLNQLIASYNTNCTTRVMFKTTIMKLRENLQCPEFE